jgi:LuxR family maltose regulon positive regulatory protein
MRVAEAQAISLGYHALARLQQARGDSTAARTILDELQDVAHQRNFVPQMLAQTAATQAQLALMQGDFSAALQWADTSGLGANDGLSYAREPEYLVLARVRIAQGRRDKAGFVLADILHLLDRLLAAAETGERLASVVEISVLRALAFQAQGTSVRALKCLERALQLAAPEGYVRVFIDEGAPMAELLGDLAAQGVMPAYVRTIVAAFPDHDRDTTPGAALQPQPLAEPLSERELEVLRMVAAGHANRAIAAALTIEVGTVKRHIHSLLGKLDAPSRTAAVARARTLGLL